MRRTAPRTRTGSPPKGRSPQANGFTLIEIMVVVVILGIMAALVVPNIAGRQEQAQRTAVESDLNALANALEFYRLDNFTYPSTEQGLEALVTQPSGYPEARRWKSGGYLRRLPTDPWGTPYQYLSSGERFELYSLGADGQEGGEGGAADIAFETP